MSAECRSAGKTRLFVNRVFTPAGPQEVTRADFSEKILGPPRPMEPSPTLPRAHAHWNSLPTPASRLPAGGKAVNTAPVPGQTPHDESDRRTEPRSSVSDLVNSLTSEMLMVRRVGDGLGGRPNLGNSEP